MVRKLTTFLFAVALAGLLPLEVRPQLRDTPEPTLKGNRVLVIAHRGGAKEAPENTLAAFDRAMQVGADGIETDLRLTRDGVVILYNDEKFGRVEGLPEAQRVRLVSDMTYAELTSFGTPGGNKVATLGEFLSSSRTGLVNIELKRTLRFDEMLTKTIEALKNFRGIDRVVLEPPDLKSAERLRKELGLQLKLHLNPAYDEKLPFDQSFERVLQFKPHSISVPYKRLSLDVVERAHKAGVEVWVWTVDSPEIAQAMRLLGVDAIKTDSPAMLVKLVKK